MRARGLNKQIEVWQTRSVDDGFGGQTLTDNLITTSFASVKTQTGQTISDLGLDYSKGVISVTTRKRKDFDYNSKTIYIKYRGDKYTITTFPTNTDFTDAFISFIAISEKPNTLPTYETIL